MNPKNTIIAAPSVMQANVLLTVINFASILPVPRRTQAKTTYLMGLEEPNSRVTKISPTILSVTHGGPLIFRIEITPTKIGNEVYVPVGIAFNQIVKRGVLGVTANVVKNFHSKQFFVIGTSLYFIDECLPAPGTIDFEFYVFIQRQSDGALAVIDPGIQHEN